MYEKYKPNYSAQECVEKYLFLQEEAPTLVVMRDAFVKKTGISKREIEFHFGTFTEFRRIAGFAPTRKEVKLKAIKAKEVTAEKIRELSQDRFDWANTFTVNPFKKKFLQFIVISDVHDEMCDPFFRRMTLQAISDIKVDKVIFNGDLFDNAEVSNYNQRLCDYNPVKKTQWVHNYISDIRDIVPNAEIILVEGNHEYRLVAHLLEKSPYIADMLSLNGKGVREFLGLDKYHVNYYARADFGAFTEKDIKNELMRNYYKFEDKVLFHHFPVGKQFGMPGVHGHHHSYYVDHCFNATYGSYQWIQSGGGVRRHVDYQVNMGEMWDNGFVVVTIDIEDRKNTILEYVNTTNKYCRLNGSIYERNEQEMVFLR